MATEETRAFFRENLCRLQEEKALLDLRYPPRSDNPDVDDPRLRSWGEFSSRPEPRRAARHARCPAEWGEWLLWLMLPPTLVLLAIIAILAWRVVNGGCP